MISALLLAASLMSQATSNSGASQGASDQVRSLPIIAQSASATFEVGISIVAAPIASIETYTAASSSAGGMTVIEY